MRRVIEGGYVRASESSKSFDDPGVFIELPLVNKIRPRVNAWREADYPGASGITKRLLKHWGDPEQRESDRQFFFCGLEAIETLIWLTEAPAADRVGIDIPSDGGDFTRLCSKMATGSGKTIVMAMLITWQVINKATYPQDKRFSKNILVIAPGLTVKNRLEVLLPGSPGNYYGEFRIVPPGLEDRLRQGQTCRVLIRNWHKLDWETEEQIRKRRSVDTLRLHERVECVRVQHLIQPLVERMPARPRQLICGNPEPRSPRAVLATTHRHGGSVVRRIDRVDPRLITGC